LFVRRRMGGKLKTAYYDLKKKNAQSKVIIFFFLERVRVKTLRKPEKEDEPNLQ